MALNSDLEKKYVNKLAEMKRYIRDEKTFNELVEKADKKLNQTDYSYEWMQKRRDFINYLVEYFELSSQEAGAIKVKKLESDTASKYAVQIEISGTPIKPKYTIGTNKKDDYETLWSGVEQVYEDEEDD